MYILGKSDEVHSRKILKEELGPKQKTTIVRTRILPSRGTSGDCSDRTTVHDRSAASAAGRNEVRVRAHRPTWDLHRRSVLPLCVSMYAGTKCMTS